MYGKKHILMDDETSKIITNDAVMEKASLKRTQVSLLASKMGYDGIITSEDFLDTIMGSGKCPV